MRFNNRNIFIQNIFVLSKLENENKGEQNANKFKFQLPKLSGPLSRKIIDIAEYADHITINVPIAVGQKIGHVYIFSHREHLREGIINFYKDGLKNQIEVKKYIVSEKVGYDVGPLIAVAELIEDGDYGRFLKIFETEKVKLTGLEHVLLVEERGRFYHLLPAEDVSALANYEQIGLIRYSIYSSLKEGVVNGDFSEDIIFRIIAWITSHDIDFKKFRDFFESCRINRIEGYDREYKYCIIFDNLFEMLKQKFRLQEPQQELSNFEQFK